MIEEKELTSKVWMSRAFKSSTLSRTNSRISLFCNAIRLLQLRAKKQSEKEVLRLAKELQALCKSYKAVFVLNDYSHLAVAHGFDGLHIGKSDYENFKSIRQAFDGILGVSCYADVNKAQEFEAMGADYVAFGSFFPSPTKPHSKVVGLEVLREAKAVLNIPVCAIGGINMENVTAVLEHGPQMLACISAIWQAEDIQARTKDFATALKERK